MSHVFFYMCNANNFHKDQQMLCFVLQYHRESTLEGPSAVHSRPYSNYIQSGKALLAFLCRVLFSDFYCGGACAQTLAREEGGNISYLCRQNFISLLYLDSNQHPSDLE